MSQITKILKQIKLDCFTDKQAQIIIISAFRAGTLHICKRLDDEHNEVEQEDNDNSFVVNAQNEQKLIEMRETIINEKGEALLVYGDGGSGFEGKTSYDEVQRVLEVIKTNYRDPSFVVYY
jgi:hypothetical protein